MKRRFRFPVSAKVVTFVLVSAIVLVEVSMLYFSLVSSKANEDDYKSLATNLSNTVSRVLDVDKFVHVKNEVKAIVDASENKVMSSDWGSDAWNAYTAQFDGVASSQEFIEIRDYLRNITDANSKDVDCIYLSYVDTVNEKFVYVVDAALEDACPPGCLDPIFDINREVLTNPARGFPAYITNTEEYGWLVSSGAPIYSGEEVVGYAMVDISMDVVRGSQAQRIMLLFIYLASTAVGLIIVSLIITHFLFVKRIRKLNQVANTYDANDDEKTHQAFANLTIWGHDEISDLAVSIKKLESDLHNKIAELSRANEELVAAQKETKKMTELANKDALTGVRNKVRYDADVAAINKTIASKDPDLQFGIAMIDLNDLKVINDEYGHESGNVALVKLSTIICGIFAHSPVYRVGGDEFVVILRGSDYRRSDELIAEFNQKIENLSKDTELTLAERASAAIGYSKYDLATDDDVESVFKRADDAMYCRKREMKKK